MKKLKLLLAFIASIIAISNSKAQVFSYSLSNNNTTYSDLVSATSLSNGSDWNNTTFKTAIGFSFPFAGQSFDSLRIEPNGFIVFDNKRNYAFASYKGLFCKQDSNETWSSVSYLLSGSILKLQFKNVGFYPYNKAELFNYQVWIYSSGNIEVHTGPNPNLDYIANDQTTLLGPINMNQDSNPKAFLASGSPVSPSGNSLGTNDPIVYLNPIPANGNVFVFMPQ
jgi:hypothetical protein